MYAGAQIFHEFTCSLDRHVFVYPQVQQLIAELNEILAHDIVDEGGLWKKKLTDQSLKLFDFLPQAIKEQLMLERDPHGNVQVYLGLLFTICLFHCHLWIFYQLLWFMLYQFLLGCQNRNRKDAYSNGWNWVGEEEARRFISWPIQRAISFLRVCNF